MSTVKSRLRPQFEKEMAILLYIALLTLMVTLTACFRSTGIDTPIMGETPPASPSQTALPLAEATATSAPIVQGQWTMLAPGMEGRIYIPYNNALSTLTVLRFDPALYTFRAHYQPGQARNLIDWVQTLPDAAALVNANFFYIQNTITGLLVSEGVLHGQSYMDRGGTFAVMNGQPLIRSNIYEHYRGEPYEQAVQAFPMLVLNGQQAFTDSQQIRGSRRTAVGMDAQGRVLLLASPGFGLSLTEFSAYLPTTDMDLVSAFNLDGGGSTMMYAAPIAYRIPSFDPVPAVLAVYPRF